MADVEEELKQALTHEELQRQKSESNVEDLPTSFTAGTSGKGKRTEYGICICITKIRDIDMVNGNFFGQGTLHFSWPASAEDIENFAKDPVGYDPSIKPNWRFSNAISFERELIPYETGNPYAVLANEDPNVFGNRVRFIDPEGRYNFICYDISGNFAQTFHVQHYPVDTQDCIITIEGVDKVENMLFREPWDIRYETGAISTNHCSVPDYKLHPPKIELNMLRYVSSFATLSFVGKLERIWWLVVLRLGLFLMIVSFSCIFSFVMDPIDEIDGRLAHQFVIILTLVAFQFVLNEELPKTPYLTYMDLYSFSCFFYVFVITAAQSIIAYAQFSKAVDDIVAIFAIVAWLLYHLYFAIKLIQKRKLEMKKLDHVPADYNEGSGLQHCAAGGNYIETTKSKSYQNTNEKQQKSKMNNNIFSMFSMVNLDSFTINRLRYMIKTFGMNVKHSRSSTKPILVRDIANFMNEEVIEFRNYNDVIRFMRDLRSMHNEIAFRKLHEKEDQIPYDLAFKLRDNRNSNQYHEEEMNLNTKNRKFMKTKTSPINKKIQRQKENQKTTERKRKIEKMVNDLMESRKIDFDNGDVENNENKHELKVEEKKENVTDGENNINNAENDDKETGVNGEEETDSNENKILTLFTSSFNDLGIESNDKKNKKQNEMEDITEKVWNIRNILEQREREKEERERREKEKERENGLKIIKFITNHKNDESIKILSDIITIIYNNEEEEKKNDILRIYISNEENIFIEFKSLTAVNNFILKTLVAVKNLDNINDEFILKTFSNEVLYENKKRMDKVNKRDIKNRNNMIYKDNTEENGYITNENDIGDNRYYEYNAVRNNENNMRIQREEDQKYNHNENGHEYNPMHDNNQQREYAPIDSNNKWHQGRRQYDLNDVNNGFRDRHHMNASRGNRGRGNHNYIKRGYRGRGRNNNNRGRGYFNKRGRGNHNYINKANDYNMNNMEKNPFNHINTTNMNNDTIIRYKNDTLFTDNDIMKGAEQYYEELYTESNMKISNEQIDEIYHKSFEYDEDEQNKSYTEEELMKIMNKIKNNKAKGLDLISYKLIKTMCKQRKLRRMVLQIINIIHYAAIYPTQLKTDRITMMKKKVITEIFRHFRGITITNNIKSIIDKLRYERVKDKYKKSTHKNDAAYIEGIGTEILAYFIIKRTYKCMVPLIADLMKKDFITTTNIRNFMQVLVNMNRLRYLKCSENKRMCAMCDEIRSTSANIHAVKECKVFKNGYLWNTSDTINKIKILETIQKISVLIDSK